MATDYIKAREDRSPVLAVNYSFVQSFHVPPTENKALNEGYVMRVFISLDEAERKKRIEILKAVYRFQFLNELQIEKIVSMAGFDASSVKETLADMVRMRQINYFFLAETALSYEPADGERFYCTDLAGRYILSHYFREDVLMWKMTDNCKSPEQVVKYLSAAEFYFAVMESNPGAVRVFEPVFNAPIATRDIRFSAYIEMKEKGTVRRFILESVREADVPDYFRRKVIEQMGPFSRGQYKRSVPELPEFILLCENKDIALEASDIYYRYFEKQNFLLITDEMVAQGIQKGGFFKYNPPKEEGAIGKLAKGNVGIFLSDK